ncbi:MAG TPA: DUF362 domain-containing protein [Anaerolinea thermolimosa]|uniref:DUF362 domain-containing protein n=2 Tax=Anaerolinea thermolimosa TaxID=229919 RepID=A0A3D1JCC6_9CHLR|nr:DUF362 domain-containing protein [Anaerolinea thermolimosa]
MKNPISRREALRYLALASAAALVACQSNRGDQKTGSLAGTNPRPTEPEVEAENLPLTASPPASPSADSALVDGVGENETTATPQPSDQVYLSVARGEDPAAITEAAMRALGGMERFVKNGYDVIIKPNICTDTYTFEYGATTNPAVVGTLVRLALGAGAKRVRVMDFPFGGTPESAYARSGIADAVKAAGGEMEIMNRNKFRLMSVPDYQSLNKTAAYQDALDCDLLINVPITKHHTMARITVGCKNLMGLILDRGAIHSDFKRRIPDLVNLFRPGLTVVDAVRTLMANGPTGGNLDDVVLNNTVIASHDVVAADSYATRFFGLTGADIPYIAFAAERGLGQMDLSGLKIEEINV